jgi:hypothetical protein
MPIRQSGAARNNARCKRQREQARQALLPSVGLPYSCYLLPGLLKYLKNSEFESITITSPCALKLAR